MTYDILWRIHAILMGTAFSAGAYGIQAYGSKYIKEVNGDYFTIVGLPIAKLYKKLKEL